MTNIYVRYLNFLLKRTARSILRRTGVFFKSRAITVTAVSIASNGSKLFRNPG